jgi:hypothetical protein
MRLPPPGSAGAARGIHYLALAATALVVMGGAAIFVAGAFALLGQWGWIVVIGAGWFCGHGIAGIARLWGTATS